MKKEKKDSEKSFLAKLRKELGISTQWKMSQCLNISFPTYYSAEQQPGLPSRRLMKLINKKFGWDILSKHIKSELDKDKD